MATNYKAILSEFTEQVDASEKARENKSDSPEVKLARAARQVIQLAPEAAPTMPSEEVSAWLNSLSALSVDAFDRTQGDLLGSRIDALLKLDPEDAPASFASIADDARSALTRWLATKPGRRSGNGSGESTKESNPNQWLDTFGIDKVELTMTSDALDAPVSIAHGSTWSSLSDQINRVSKVIDGMEDAPPRTYSYGIVDPSARVAWRAFVADVKQNPNAHSEFNITLGKGTLHVVAQGVAKVSA